MKELMVHVERIVRPIRADASKLRIRNELLAHLQAAYDQGRAEGLDEPAALAEAKRRLGDPATLTRELQASIPKYERLAVTPFPTSVTRAMLVLAAITPIVIAMGYVPIRTMSQGNRVLFIAGIVTLELTCWLWYSFTVPLYRRPIHWRRVAVAGIAACITQFAWQAMVSFALTGHALSHDLASAGAFLMIPAFFAVGGFAAVLGTRRVKPWLELDIAQ